MGRMVRPIVPETDKRILSQDELRALLRTTDGNEFEHRRDKALLLLMIDTGARLSGVAGVALDDVDLDLGIVRIFGKGRRHYLASMGSTTVKALDRYLRIRRGHRLAGRPELWLARKGPLTGSGIVQVVRRRARDAALKGVHPHAFRHTFAHAMKSAGASDEDVMALGDWRSKDAMQGYGRTLRAERALVTHKRLSPADTLTQP
ncbi:MAG: tyrosine-type recombinase/integrase [Actinomycetota bacterium]